MTIDFATPLQFLGIVMDIIVRWPMVTARRVIISVCWPVGGWNLKSLPPEQITAGARKA